MVGFSEKVTCGVLSMARPILPLIGYLTQSCVDIETIMGYFSTTYLYPTDSFLKDSRVCNV